LELEEDIHFNWIAYLVVGIGKEKGKERILLSSQDLGTDRPYQYHHISPGRLSLRVVGGRSSGPCTWNTRQLQLKHKKKRRGEGPREERRGEEWRGDYHHTVTPITERKRESPTYNGGGPRVCLAGASSLGPSSHSPASSIPSDACK